MTRLIPSPPAPPESAIDLLARIASVASLLYLVELSLDSLTFDHDCADHDTERMLAAQTSLDAALIEIRSLGVAVTGDGSADGR